MVHKPISSSELVEWAAELSLRAADEKAAYDEADVEGGDNGQNDGLTEEERQEIIARAREKGHIE